MRRYFFLRTGNYSGLKKVRISSSKCIKGKLLRISTCHQNGRSVDGLEVAELSQGARWGIVWRQPFSVEVL